MTVTYQKELDLVGTQMMEVVAKEQRCAAAVKAAHLFGEIIQQHLYVGEVYSIGYETALVQIHDHHRQRVGGLCPYGSVKVGGDSW